MKALTKILVATTLLLFGISAQAQAAGEVASANLELTPQKGSFYTNGLSPANWRLETSITSRESTILPTKRISLKMPGSDRLRFVPPSGMPVCPDNKIGPNTYNSAPVDIIKKKCPQSILGNGDATFLLNQNNNRGSQLYGVLLVFNGGLVSGNPRLKFWAYSYDTGVAIYTAGVLRNGSLDIPIPQLTSDSSVNSLNVSIPGKTENIYLPTQDQTVTLPAGQAREYVMAKCPSSPLPFESAFLLGKRLSDGTPSGEEFTLQTNNPIACSGVVGKVSLVTPSIKGPSKVRAKKSVAYNVSVRNRGGGDAREATLLIKGKGIQKRISLGTIPGSSSKSTKVKITFKNRGKIRLSFTASAKGANKTTANKTVTVS